MNNEQWFWNIIQQAQQNRAKLNTFLLSLNKEEIIRFQDIFLDFAIELQDEPYTGFMEESEDGIEDISHWVVSKGKDYYTHILQHPEDIPFNVEDVMDENLYGIADEVCYAKYNETTGLY
ncbi:MAG: DUF4240 domain-containing protein [Flavobacteriaceae bacterium]|jgi:hypothetical protein|nr:DUF4240 domain-containing protein [Flavobacteriaceae bacterium]